MDTSIMQNALGVFQQDCQKLRYEDNNLVLEIQTPKEKLCCPVCGSHNINRNGSHIRRFVSVPIGLSKTYLDMRVHRIQCHDCGCIKQEDIDFAKGKRRHTIAFANMVLDLSRFATIQDISCFLQVSWDVVRNIQMEFLQSKYSNPDLSMLRRISIDEFATHKGHVYKTIVVDLDNGHIVYVGDGNGKYALDGFWERLGKDKEHIQAVCTDLSAAYTRAVSERLPNAALVVDHFHVTKLMNEKVDLLRRQIWHEEKDINKRKVIKGTRWLLLKNGNDIFDYAHRNRLENALSLNRPLMIAYYLKEDLKEIWNQCSKQKAKDLLDEWVKQAIESKIQPLVKMASTIRAYKTYILAWYDHCITNGTIEGINNKIKVLKRQIYGFRNEEYFTLRLYALHDRHLRI